jgi:peptidoglycan biosynthesis protein MviN/MurJ (putative lipid II flippase)
MTTTAVTVAIYALATVLLAWAYAKTRPRLKVFSLLWSIVVGGLSLAFVLLYEWHSENQFLVAIAFLATYVALWILYAVVSRRTDRKGKGVRNGNGSVFDNGN